MRGLRAVAISMAVVCAALVGGAGAASAAPVAGVSLNWTEVNVNDGVDGFAFPFDDQVPVHGFLSCVKNKTGTQLTY